jgi:UDP-N-acetylglucosamine 2-epimerase
MDLVNFVKNEEKLRITAIFGTRPEIIRMSEILKKIDQTCNLRIIHSGQNSDINLSDVFFQELGIRKPDLNLMLSNLSLGNFLGGLMAGVEKELLTNKPDAVLILGDTNTALSTIIAKRMYIPVYHIEAGNRSSDNNIPEEINRVIVDHASDFHLAYTENSRRNLIAEGIEPRTIAVIGSPLKEVIDKNYSSIQNSDILEKLGLNKNKFFLFSSHRQENIDDESRLELIVRTLNRLADEYSLPVVVTSHPRLLDKLKKVNLEISDLVRFESPFSFFEFCKLSINARVVISDSGSICEESAILGTKAISLRNSSERPEAIESGSLILSGIRPEEVMRSIEILESDFNFRNSPAEYLFDDSSVRVLRFLASTISNFHFWKGIRTTS